jgi:hypothetical protein
MKKIIGIFVCMLLIATAVSVVTAENHPPYPPMIAGPAQGKVGISYNYTISTMDPDGDNVSYWVEWGDGTHDGWIGPISSGEHIMVNHTWAERGSYLIKAKAKDINQAESNFSIPLEMNVTGPQLDIIIRPRGFGVSATIVNTGEDTAVQVAWKITLDGGIIFFGKSKESTITEILPERTVTVTSLIFGFFKSNIIATVGNSSDSLGGFLVGPFLFSIIKNETYNGSILKINVTNKEITVQKTNTGQRTFKIDPRCKFKDKNGNIINSSQFKEGDKVKVTWRRNQGTAGDTQRVAIEIQKLE